MRNLRHPVTLGMLVGLAACLQLGPVYWPWGGYLLSMLATLPMAFAGALAPNRALWVYIAGMLVIGAFSPDEAYVFALMTGLLGLAIGWTASRPLWQGSLLSGLTLAAGMLLFCAITGAYPWGGIEQAWPKLAAPLAYLVFSACWALLWCLLFRSLWRRVNRALSGGAE